MEPTPPTLAITERTVDIILEHDDFKESSIIGFIYDGKGKSCKFCYDICQRDKYWKLTILNKSQIWIRIGEIPNYSKGDYYNRIIINYLIDNLNKLITKAEEH